jgi:hypothetical protein
MAFLDQGVDGLAHPVFVGAEAEDADARNVAPVDDGAREEHPAARVHATEELGAQGIAVAPGSRPHGEGDDRELRLVE